MSEYGCHVDLLPGDKPDGCVLDIGRAVDCLVAQSLKASGLGKSECMHWRPIADCASELSRAYALIEELRAALGACVASLERADTSEGVCMCGDSMTNHADPMHAGHSPDDMGDHYASDAIIDANHRIAKASAFLAERVK